MLEQIISLVGALLILGAYAANQTGMVRSGDRGYSIANFVGSMLLLWVAVVDQRAGFIVLESAWALISVPHMIRPRPRNDPPSSPNPTDPSSRP